MFGRVYLKSMEDSECQQTCSFSTFLIGQRFKHVLACLRCQPIKCGYSLAVTNYRIQLYCFDAICI